MPHDGLVWQGPQVASVVLNFYNLAPGGKAPEIQILKFVSIPQSPGELVITRFEYRTSFALVHYLVESPSISINNIHVEALKFNLEMCKQTKAQQQAPPVNTHSNVSLRVSQPAIVRPQMPIQRSTSNRRVTVLSHPSTAAAASMGAEKRNRLEEVTRDLSLTTPFDAFDPIEVAFLRNQARNSLLVNLFSHPNNNDDGTTPIIPSFEIDKEQEERFTDTTAIEKRLEEFKRKRELIRNLINEIDDPTQKLQPLSLYCQRIEKEFEYKSVTSIPSLVFKRE